MQIPTNFSAAQAASIASFVSSRDKDSGVPATPATAADTIQNQLEKSESASPDRDAQGQSDGLGHHARKSKDENSVAGDESPTEGSTADTITDTLAPPGLLDLTC